MGLTMNKSVWVRKRLQNRKNNRDLKRKKRAGGSKIHFTIIKMRKLYYLCVTYNQANNMTFRWRTMCMHFRFVLGTRGQFECEHDEIYPLAKASKKVCVCVWEREREIERARIYVCCIEKIWRVRRRPKIGQFNERAREEEKNWTEYQPTVTTTHTHHAAATVWT